METKIFEDFELMEGKTKVMLSAPHAFIHLRDNEIKLAETNTDRVVIDVAEELNTYAVYKTISSDNDANWDKNSEYRNECLKTMKRAKIGLIIDVHGMASDRAEDICIGIDNYELVNNNKEFIEKVVDIFHKNGFENISIDSPFNAQRKECVSNFMHAELGIMAMQLEINGKYRFLESDTCRLDEIKKSLKEIINYYINNK